MFMSSFVLCFTTNRLKHSTIGTKPSCLNQNKWTLRNFDLFAITFLVFNAPFEFANVKKQQKRLKIAFSVLLDKQI